MERGEWTVQYDDDKDEYWWALGDPSFDDPTKMVWHGPIKLMGLAIARAKDAAEAKRDEP